MTHGSAGKLYTNGTLHFNVFDKIKINLFTAKKRQKGTKKQPNIDS